MSIQFLGMIGHRLSSETIAPVGPIFDRDYIVFCLADPRRA